MRVTSAKIAIAIPAYNEAMLIGRCLDAIAAQEDAGDISVVVLANNCSDATADYARVRRTVPVTVVEHHFGPEERSAGHARRLAVAHAAESGEIILTTDADCIADRDWVAAHRRAFAGGVDAVAGRVSADWEELQHHPPDALRIGALEWDYLGLIGEAEALYDPRPHDPLPRHAQRCGANLGITRAMLERIGGVPAIAVGEDRALLAAVDDIDGKIRFDRGPHVTASARISGRAGGGMADALAARVCADYRCDDQFVAADLLVDLWRKRAIARAAWLRGEQGFGLEAETGVADSRFSTFGAAWADHIAELPRPPQLRPSDLPREIVRLQALIAEHD
jgi:glycosyltransferase involved in cell wall biosynthesis